MGRGASKKRKSRELKSLRQQRHNNYPKRPSVQQHNFIPKAFTTITPFLNPLIGPEQLEEKINTPEIQTTKQITLSPKKTPLRKRINYNLFIPAEENPETLNLQGHKYVLTTYIDYYTNIKFEWKDVCGGHFRHVNSLVRGEVESYYYLTTQDGTLYAKQKNKTKGGIPIYQRRMLNFQKEKLEIPQTIHTQNPFGNSDSKQDYTDNHPIFKDSHFPHHLFNKQNRNPYSGVV